MKKIMMLTLLALTVCYGTVNAQKPAVVVNDKTGWHKIGETTVDFQKDMDEVSVLIADRFAAVKFKVTDAPIELLDLDLYFEEGDMQTIKVGYAIKNAGESSRQIDLNGGSERRLKKIVFHYKTLANRQDKKAHVEIWGLKTNADKDQKNDSKKNGNKNDHKNDHK